MLGGLTATPFPKIDRSLRAIWRSVFTQDDIRKVLADLNTGNRNVRKTHLDFLVQLLEEANFYFDFPHRILFDFDGNLLTGQHRLIAILQYMEKHGIESMEIEIETGCPPEFRKHIDGNQILQTIGDRLGFTSSFQSIIKAWIQLVSTKTGMRRKNTPKEVEQLLEQHRPAIEWAYSAFGKGPTCRAAVRAACAVAWEQHPEKVERFAEAIQHKSGRSGIQQADACNRWLRGFEQNGGMRGQARDFRITTECLASYIANRKAAKKA